MSAWPVCRWNRAHALVIFVSASSSWWWRTVLPLKLLAQLLNFLAQLTVFLQQLLEGASVVMAHDGSQGCNCSSIHGSERKCEAGAFANALFDNTQLGHFR